MPWNDNEQKRRLSQLARGRDSEVQPVRGDIPVADATSYNFLPLGASGHYLRSDGTDALWQDLEDHDHTGDAGDGARLTLHDYYNGTILEPLSFTVASNGTTITGSLAQSGGGDLTLHFSDGETTFDCTPAATVALTAGADNAPQKNYVYILQSDKSTMVRSTSGWPSEEHAKIAEVIVQSASTVASISGGLVNRNWNDFAKGADDQGHHTHVWERLRWEHSAWKSGGAATYTRTANGGAADNMDVAVTAAKVYQLHLQDVDAFNTAGADVVRVVNQPAPNAYTTTGDLATLLTDSGGGSMSGKYYNLVLWASVSSGSEKEFLFVNLPSGSYNKQGDATADVSGFDNYSIPSDFRGYAFLISRITLRHQAAASGTTTSIQETDLRGQVPNIVAGGGTAAITTEFADNQFVLFDEGDPTRELAFQVSGVSASTKRTITVPDEDVTLIDDATSDPLIDGAAASDGTEGSLARKDHVHPRHHAESHTAASHSDQGATGAELETLTDGSSANSLHKHTQIIYIPLWTRAGGALRMDNPGTSYVNFVDNNSPWAGSGADGLAADIDFDDIAITHARILGTAAGTAAAGTRGLKVVIDATDIEVTWSGTGHASRDSGWVAVSPSGIATILLQVDGADATDDVAIRNISILLKSE